MRGVYVTMRPDPRVKAGCVLVGLSGGPSDWGGRTRKRVVHRLLFA